MISVICSRCGGTGQLTYLQEASTTPWSEVCPECEGRGIVQELSFEERKELKQKEGKPCQNLSTYSERMT